MVSSAVPNPANCRIVHSRPRYIDGYTPRVNGGSPGSPIASSTSAGRSASVYSGLIGTPLMVSNGTSRSGVRANTSRSQRSMSERSRGSVAMAGV